MTIERLDTNQDPQEVLREIHKLSGSAAVLGAHRLCGKLMVIEAALKAKRTEMAQESLAELPSLWAKTRATLQGAQAETVHKEPA